MEGKAPLAQAAQCQSHLGHNSIGAGCSNQIQVTQGQDLHWGGALVQAAFGCCIPLLLTCGQDSIETVQLALVVFSFHQLVQILHLHSWWSSPAATCAGGVFPQSTSAFSDVHIAICTVWLVVVVLVFLCCDGDCMWWWLYI